MKISFEFKNIVIVLLVSVMTITLSAAYAQVPATVDIVLSTLVQYQTKIKHKNY